MMEYYGNAENLGKSILYVKQNEITFTEDGRAIYGCFANTYFIGNVITHKEKGYCGMFLNYNSEQLKDSIWLINNVFNTSKLRMYEGNQYYIYNNQFNNAESENIGNPQIIELFEDDLKNISM